MYFKSYRLFRLRPGNENEEVCGRVQSCAKWMGVACDDAVDDGPWYTVFQVAQEAEEEAEAEE